MKSIPFGRLPELKSHPDAHVMAICHGRSWDSDFLVKTYTSRRALESFLKNPGKWTAIERTTVPKNCVVHPAFQSEVQS